MTLPSGGPDRPNKLYGIKNCDAVKRARAWLDAGGHAYVFHDFRVDGVDRQQLERWCRICGWETLLNRAGKTFRALPDADRQVSVQGDAIALMMAQPSMIKRPVLERGPAVFVGFKPDVYADCFPPALSSG